MSYRRKGRRKKKVDTEEEMMINRRARTRTRTRMMKRQTLDKWQKLRVREGK